MTTHPAIPADDLIIRPGHLLLALNLSERSLAAHITKGNIPGPDGRGYAGLKLWRLSTIRAWNSGVADQIEQLLAIPVFAPRPPRHSNTPLLAA